MRKKVVCLVLALVMALAAVSPAVVTANETAGGIRVTFDGRPIEFSHPILERHGFAFFQVDEIFNALADATSWNGETRTIRGERGGHVVEIQVDELIYIVDGAVLDVQPELAPFVYNDLIYVYIDFVVAGLGLATTWDGAARTLHIGDGDVDMSLFTQAAPPVSGNMTQERRARNTARTLQVDFNGGFWPGQPPPMPARYIVDGDGNLWTLRGLGGATRFEGASEDGTPFLLLRDVESFARGRGGSTSAITADGNLLVGLGVSRDTFFDTTSFFTAERYVQAVPVRGSGLNGGYAVDENSVLWEISADRIRFDNQRVFHEPVKLAENVAAVITQQIEQAGIAETYFGMTFVITNDNELLRRKSRGNRVAGEPEFYHFMYNVADVSIGDDHVLILRTDGTLYAFGDNSFGQFGLDHLESSDTPVRVRDGVKAVTAGPRYSAVILDDNSLWAWGGLVMPRIFSGFSEANLHAWNWQNTMYTHVRPYMVMENVAEVAFGGTRWKAVLLARTLDGYFYESVWSDDFNYSMQRVVFPAGVAPFVSTEEIRHHLRERYERAALQNEPLHPPQTFDTDAFNAWQRARHEAVGEATRAHLQEWLQLPENRGATTEQVNAESARFAAEFRAEWEAANPPDWEINP